MIIKLNFDKVTKPMEDTNYKILYEKKCEEVDNLLNQIKALKISKEDEELKNIKITKDKIIELFTNNVKGKKVILDNYDKCHAGKEGHWLELQMKIIHNSKNIPDIEGFEMKKSSNKITIGDFSASEYAFSKRRSKINNLNGWSKDLEITRTEYIHYFGEFNEVKKRYSWSGKCVPKYGKYNDCGQIIEFNEFNDIIIKYSYSKDTRERKTEFPNFLKYDNITIAFWSVTKMKTHIDKKFNCRGFFICKKENDTYQKICFGKPFNFEYFVMSFKCGKIIFDSGMYEGNSRNYSQFRGSSFWDELIYEEH